MKLLSVLIVTIFVSGCSTTKGPSEVSDHYDGTRFHNLNREVQGRKSLYDVLKWKLGGKELEEMEEAPMIAATPNLPSTIDSNEVFVTFINHATALIQVEGLTILTDPVFSEYIGPISLFGFERSQKAGLLFKDIPKVDLVLISHNHYDHLDLPSIRQIVERDDPLFVVPLKNGALLKEVGAQKIVELDWWEGYRLNQRQKVILTPAQHWSARGLFDDCKSLWGGFVVISDRLKVFFAGDTGYASHFQEIYNRWGAMDVSLLPIGCYKPRWFMRDVHMDPDDALDAHVDLHSSFSIAIHFGTFKLADDEVNQPVTALNQALKNRGMPPSQFVAPLNGQTLFYRKGTRYRTRDTSSPCKNDANQDLTQPSLI
jgi:L-ascorbate metabolism protein UlaG (beta-lactamase superfamily)